jgi:hypothetical protein
MKKLLALVLVLALLPFMAVGFIFEFVAFGIECGRGAAHGLLGLAFDKEGGGA